ncbi:MAG: hypothetical protein Q9P14_15940 [candidate division KSB1 bacterium]|nr:hypothetical protein [candidate division KSB1 bacterium]
MAYRFFSLVLIFLMLLPLVLVYIAFRISFIIMLRMLGFHPGFSLFGNVFWIMIGRGAHGGGREEPVIHLVVRTPTGEQRTVRIKGHLVRGSIQSGDHIAVNGNWDGGTLIFRNGYNQTLDSQLRLRANAWKGVLIFLLLLAAGMVLYALSQPSGQW